MGSNSTRKAEEQGKNDPKPVKQPWYNGVLTFIFTRRYV